MKLSIVYTNSCIYANTIYRKQKMNCPYYHQSEFDLWSIQHYATFCI